MREEISRLKQARHAIVLAHNYQLPEVQDQADIVGDSLELAVRAKEATADVIVVCGVDFMAETAKILNPGRTVLIPARDATCPMAQMLTPEMLMNARRLYPDAAVVVYVNSTAACKALADVTCTSANAEKVVGSLKERDIIFAPDANLAAYVQKRLPHKRIIPVPAKGYCYVHENFTPEDVKQARERGGKIICHPECSMEVQDQADEIASTGGMIRKAPESEVWSVFTEKEMVYRLKKMYPEKTFYAKEGAICYDMKKITIRDLYRCLQKGEYEVTLPADVMERARGAIERMISLGR